MILQVLVVVGGLKPAGAAWFRRTPEADRTVARVHAHVDGDLVVRGSNESDLRSWLTTAFDVSPKIPFGRYGDEYGLNLTRMVPRANAAWLARMGRSRILPDERGDIRLTATTCAEVDRVGVLFGRWQSRGDEVHTLDATGGACRMDVTRMLPEPIVATLGLIRPGVNGLNAALFAAGLSARSGQTSAREFLEVLKARCRRRAGMPAAGDLVVIFDRPGPKGVAVPRHAFVHVAEDLAFEKPGRGGPEPYWFVPAAAIFDDYGVDLLDQFPAHPARRERRAAVAYSCAAS